MTALAEIMKEKGFSGSRAELARLFAVSRSSLYYHPKRPALDEAFKGKILEVLSCHPAYGHRRIAIELGMNKKAVSRVMRKFDIRPPVRRKRPVSRGKREKKELVNFLDTAVPITPDFVWAGDFTEIEIHGKRIIYLATVIDIHTREIVGWSLGIRHTAALVIDTLRAAEKKRIRLPQAFHSDQGSEYMSMDCTQWLRERDIFPSYSPAGKPWKNGYQESFFNTLKLEIGNTGQFKNTTDLYEAVAALIHYYNEKRIHGVLKMPPRVFYEKEREKMKEAKEWARSST